MDFYRIRERAAKNGVLEIYPDFQVCRSRNIMVQGKSFAALWDEEKGLWSTDEYDTQRLIDRELSEYAVEAQKRSEGRVSVKYLGDFSSGSWSQFRNWITHISDNAKQLDSNLTFANTPVRKEDYASKRLPYSLEPGKCDAFEELISTLYDPEEREKLEWAIGAIVSGDSKDIQKFVVLYGEAGAGKSTILNIIEKLFEGYTVPFEAKQLVGSNNQFALEAFKTNPLVAIQHDGDLSRIEDNTKLNSLVSHEMMVVNEKYKTPYAARANAFLFMGTNKPVKITDAKSGIIRRLIDVSPSGRKIPHARYFELMRAIDSELGAIAYHCLDVYKSLGRNYYDGYKPLNMMFRTDVFYNFVEDSYLEFAKDDGVTLTRAYDMYKSYCEATLVEYKMPRHVFREELKNYFASYEDRGRIDGHQVRHHYSGFLKDKFAHIEPAPEPIKDRELVLDQPCDILDNLLADCHAQYANDDGFPTTKWANVVTTLKDLDTTRLHYVKVPENHIVIDFDLKDENGEKDARRNLQAACDFPDTYAEFSKSGAGIHLHYEAVGSTEGLAAEYAPGIEVKVFRGGSALRRVSSRSNGSPVARLSTDTLPHKEGVRMLNPKRVSSDKALRDLIERNLRKEIHPGTKPSIDFIKKILDDAYADGLEYNLEELRPRVLSFAANSSHQASYCIALVKDMKFKSDHDPDSYPSDKTDPNETDLIFFDVEVFPNLFLVCWKREGGQLVTMINPKPIEIEALVENHLVGFNCRRYDNHILYAAYMGYSNEELFKLSQRIVDGDRSAFFPEAYNLSYTDVYDFASTKQSLKKWEIELGLPHKELGIQWDRPVDGALWERVGLYCGNDVLATESVFQHLAPDWEARKVLAQVSGLSVNDTTNAHTTRIIFGTDRNPQAQFVYTDLSEMFPGYVYSYGKSTYRGEETGEGGYVYSEPGIYHNVALLDVASMHPTSIEQLNLFGPYTKRFSDLKNARLAIKHGDMGAVSKALDGAFKPYLEAGGDAKTLSYSLKIAINSVYGLTAARFDNKFKDPRNVDNIVAKRGALFMVDLKHYIQEQGYRVIHIKTDSVKIADADDHIIKLVTEFGKKYGYDFEHEATYDQIALVNDAVYIAQDKEGWHATGAQFQHPVVFKTLFSKEELTLDDYAETKSVTTALYLDFGTEENPDLQFVGKIGRFTPVKADGGRLLREKDGKYYAAGGSKGYLWVLSDTVTSIDQVDLSYSENLVRAASDAINKFGEFNYG